MPKINFGGTIERVITRKEFPLKKARQVLKNETIAIIGYGVQGQAQSLNLKDNGFNVIVGQRKGKSWGKAKKDGWAPAKNLFSIKKACQKGTIICYTLSDAGQKKIWGKIKKYLTKGKTLSFAHGFSIVYQDQTEVIPPEDIDVIMAAPKGPGILVREKGVGASYAIYQDVTGKAKQKALALCMGINSTCIYETTFKKEVYGDLTGERGVLVGAMAGLMEAQYNELRKRGHTPSEAFNETVEEATRNLIPLIDKNGMEWMFANCSTTAQRGALDWRHEFRKAVEPVFKRLYD
ncbi:MAG: hypothetical protein ACD_65C00282G0003, partial [uncultured bacterium]